MIQSSQGRIRFRVYGTPVTQGSMRAFKVGERVVTTHDNRKVLTAWRDAIQAAARAAHKDGIVRVAVALDLTFHLLAPKGRKVSTVKQQAEWWYPWRKPDLDKLARAVLDALKGVILADDAQVVKLTQEKIYSIYPGVDVTLRILPVGPEGETT